MSELNRLSEVIHDRGTLVGIANSCDRAYAEGTGNPSWYSPFTAEDKPEHFGRNLAGMFAVISGLSIIALLRGIPLEGNVGSILSEISDFESMPETDQQTLLRLANLSWNAGQPLIQDKGVLGRLGNINVFDTLPPEEVAKDRFQIQAAANELLNAFRG